MQEHLTTMSSAPSVTRSLLVPRLSPEHHLPTFVRLPSLPARCSLKVRSFRPQLLSAYLNRRVLGIQKWVHPRNKARFRAKSAESDDQLTAQNAETSDGPSTSFLSVLCPLLKFFSGSDPSRERNYVLEVATSSLSTLARLPWGSRAVIDLQNQETAVLSPPLRLQLFEFEACPFCRRVREAMTELDLSVEVYPCPKGSTRNRETVRRLGGREQFPFLIDPNSGISMYESGDIVKYLYEKYGQGRSPSVGLLESTLFTGWVPTLLRAGRGMTLWEKARQDQQLKKLELFSYENNPYARVVREALCELELPYILHNVGLGSTREKLLVELSGSKKVPFIIDPNSGTQMGDYKKILSYLFHTYSSP